MVDNGVYVCDKCGDELYDDCGYPLDEVFFGNQYDTTEKHLCWRCWTETESFAESLTIDNAVKVGDRTQVIIGDRFNDFWSSIYDREQIEELCRKDFEQMPKDKQIELIREYAEYDPQIWAERLEIYE